MSKRSIKNLTISQPMIFADNQDWLKNYNVRYTNRMPHNNHSILLAKYNFIGESAREMNISKGDYLKLIHNPGNGWLKVTCVNSLNSGYIPESYVEYVNFEKFNQNCLPDTKSDNFTTTNTTSDCENSTNNFNNDEFVFDINFDQISNDDFSLPTSNSFNSLSTYTSLIDDYDVHSYNDQSSETYYQNDPLYLQELDTNTPLRSPKRRLNKLTKSISVWNLSQKHLGKPISNMSPVRLSGENSSRSSASSSSASSLSASSTATTSTSSSSSSSIATARIVPPICQITKPINKKFVNNMNQYSIRNLHSKNYTTNLFQIKETNKNASDCEINTLETIFNEIKLDLEAKLESSDDSMKHNSVDSIFSKPTTPTLQNSYNKSFPTTPSTPVYDDKDDNEIIKGEYTKPILPLNILKKESIISIDKSQPLGDFIKLKVYLCNTDEDVIALKVKRINLISVSNLKLLIFKKIAKYLSINHYSLQIIDQNIQQDKDLLKYIKLQNKVSLCLIPVSKE